MGQAQTRTLDGFTPRTAPRRTESAPRASGVVSGGPAGSGRGPWTALGEARRGAKSDPRGACVGVCFGFA